MPLRSLTAYVLLLRRFMRIRKQKKFEALVREALKELPEKFRLRLENVGIVIEEEHEDKELLGLYEGVPQTHRDSGYTFVMPDKITLFRKALCEACETEEELRREIRHTVMHEIAHHFGISDERLDEIGKY